MNSTLNWPGYKQWAKEKIDDIFHHIGNGEDSSDAIYVMLKAILHYCVSDFCAAVEPKTISINLNQIGHKEGVFVINAKGRDALLTKQTLQRIAADTEQLHHFLTSESEDVERFTPALVNALSSFFSIGFFYNQTVTEIKYAHEDVMFDMTDTSEEDGIQFRFEPDKTIFGNYAVSIESISALLFDFIKDKPNLTIAVQRGKANSPLLFHSEPLVDAEARISNAVAYKIIDFQTDDYSDLLSQSNAVTIELPPQGRSRDIAMRMRTIIDAICKRMNNITIAYALEVESRLAMFPDQSIIASTMDEFYTIKRHIEGTDSEENKGGFTDFLVYTNVIVGIILPTKK